MIGGMDGQLVALVRIDSRRNEPLASRRPLTRKKQNQKGPQQKRCVK